MSWRVLSDLGKKNIQGPVRYHHTLISPAKDPTPHLFSLDSEPGIGVPGGGTLKTWSLPLQYFSSGYKPEEGKGPNTSPPQERGGLRDTELTQRITGGRCSARPT